MARFSPVSCNTASRSVAASRRWSCSARPAARRRAACREGATPPPANGLALVHFVGGDLNAPGITGRLYNDQDRPPESDAGQAVVHLPLGAADDDAVHLELTSNGTREVVLKLGKGLSLEVRDDDPVVKLEIDGGKATLEIARDGAVKLVSQGDLQLEGNKLTLKAQSDLSIEAGG